MEISGISDSLDPDSPRIHGLNEDVDARLFDIFCNVAVSKAPRGRGSRNADELRRLRARRTVMEAQCRLHKQEADILASAASNTATNFQVDDMKSLLRHQSMATNAALGLTEEIAELDREIWLLDRTCVGRSEAVISMTLVATRGCQVKFQLSYRESLWRVYGTYDVTDCGCSSSGRELAPVVQPLLDHCERKYVPQCDITLWSQCHTENRRGVEQCCAYAQHSGISSTQGPLHSNALSFDIG